MSDNTKDEPPCDPLLVLPSNTLEDGDHFILLFGDGKQVFGQCVTKKGVQKAPVKINKKCYPTYNLVGLMYGTVLEQGPNLLIPLADTEDLIPSLPVAAPAMAPLEKDTATTSANNSDNDVEEKDKVIRDNRHLVDDNKSQGLNHKELQRLKESGAEGAVIVQQIIENSATFSSKTDYSQAKYVTRKQLKYQPRCRLVRCTAAAVCEALFLKDPKKVMNLREDTLGQILSYANVNAGSQALVWETCSGVITGSLAQRMGGYGRILSIYSGQQQSFIEMLEKYNLTFGEYVSIKWIHSGDILGNCETEEDLEKADREVVQWPCPLQDHTRKYLGSMSTQQEQVKFMARRSARFARKLTRLSPLEAKEQLVSRQCDSIILVVRYDPTETLIALWPYLAPSCPFVLYSEFMEPLTECFLELQRQQLAINIRLSDTWAREYQVLPGRTHPNMNMSQSGGFILTGVKVDPVTGKNELDESVLKEIRQQLGGRRARQGMKQKRASPAEEEKAGKRSRPDS